jgi:outer membrane receptor protein involved in Fe transport
MRQRPWIRGWVIVCCAIVTANQAARGQQAAANASSAASASPSPDPAAANASPPPTPASAQGQPNLQEVIINGIKRGDLIMPTTVTSNSVYGLDLGVMDVPRNTSVVSQAQLAALNIQNPGGFSYLTSSSYSDSSFGQPNVPRIRGQYADMFFNGMRDSFTLNGYGAPISFNDVDSIDIVKGPASVQAGPGAGVGGAIDITTKMPSFTRPFVNFSLEGDTFQKRIASVDFGAPLTSNTAVRVSLTSTDSGSYYNDMYFHQQSAYIALLTHVTSNYTVLFNVDYDDTKYREDDGINRVDQNLIDNNEYLTGAPSADTISGFLTPVYLSGATTVLNPRVIIDEPAGTGAQAEHIKAQIIQTISPSDNWTIINNTFYDFLNRYNQIMAYYADTAKDSYSIENKTDVQTRFSLGSASDFIDGGVTFRFTHVWDVQNYINEPVSVYDLSGSPESWVFPAALQGPSGAFLYSAAFGNQQWGSPGRNPYFLNDSVDQNLRDAAIFLENRMVFSPHWAVLYGLRGDVVQLDYSDPLGGPGFLPQSASTAWYGLRNGNISVVYSPTPHFSTYLTYNNAQYVLPTANDGAVATWGEDPSSQLQQDTTLEELGAKLSLLNKALFISSAIFHQTRAVPIGVGLTNTVAHINGAEIELDFQPNPHFFATASYSYLHTILYSPGSTSIAPGYFYNFPAEPGLNIDGAGTLAVWKPNQSLLDPGVPQHLFNVLANYKLASGLGVQANIQVTGPINTTQSGYLDIAATNALAAADGLGTLVEPGGSVPLSVVGADGYYTSPRIPWQYTVNAAVFYHFADHYVIKLSVYDLTNQRNLLNDIPFYGNDFLTREPPRSFDLTFSGKF